MNVYIVACNVVDSIEQYLIPLYDVVKHNLKWTG